MDRKASLGLCTLWAVWATTGAIQVQGPSEVIRAVRGKNVTLPCSYTTSATDRNGVIEWKKLLWTHSENVLTWKFKTRQLISGNAYRNRMNVSANVNQSDASITIQNLTMADNGTYECSLMLLSDLDGTKSTRVHLLVLVAPSKPICSIEGQTVIGSNIQLRCHSEEGSPEPQYSWRSYDIQNQERPLVTPGSGQMLVLKNISVDMSGYFVCTSTNEVGAETCDITLAVTPPSMNVTLYVSIAVSVVGTLVILGIIIYCCCFRKKDGNKNAQHARPNRAIYRESSEQEEEQEEADYREQEADYRPSDHTDWGRESPGPDC